MNQRRKPSLLSVAVVAGPLLAAVAQAQSKPEDQRAFSSTGIQGIRIAVWDPETKQELLTLGPGETVEITEGDSVILQIFSPPNKNPTNKRQHVKAAFSIETGHQRIALRDANLSRGSCVVEVLTTRDAGKAMTATLRYELVEEVPIARKGTIPIRILEPEYELSKGEAMVWLLYRAILLRDPDRERARPWIDQVERGGYPALLEVAYEIAESRESQIHLYEREVTNQQRLLALYGHLLGVNADRIDLREWKYNLERLCRGEIVEVVMGIVDSNEFRRYHDIRRRRR